MRYTEVMLREAVAHSESYAGTMRYLGIRWSGGQQQSLRKRIQDYGIDHSHFTGQSHRRGKYDSKRLSAGDIFVRHTKSYRQKVSLLRRALDEIGRPMLCEFCGCSPEWRERPLILEIDHIDGDWQNDTAENLRYLCPNCHSQAVMME